MSDGSPPLAAAAAVPALAEAGRRLGEAADVLFGMRDLRAVHWQILATAAGVMSVPTLGSDEQRKARALLQQRGWLQAGTEDLPPVLTPLGCWAFSDLQRIERKWSSRLLDGVSAQDYRIASDVLERMLRNLRLSPR